MSPRVDWEDTAGMNTASAPVLAGLPRARRVAPLPVPLEAPRSPSWPVAILGVPFDHVTIAESVARVGEMIASRKPHYIVTANVDFLVQARHDVELRRILLDADMVLCDGTPLVWASRWLGNALPERVAGSDLAPALIRAAAAQGHRVFLLGGADGVAVEAEANLRREHPTLQLVGTYSPPFSQLLEMDHEEIVRRVRAAKPDLLLVSFGCPKQEKWIAMHHRALGVPVVIGVGATIDFMAGRVKRAPAWMRRSGSEWLYRLAQEPRRLYRRYANDLLRFLPAFAAQWFRLSASRQPPARPFELSFARPGWCHLDAGDQLTRHSLDHDAAFWRAGLARTRHCLLDLSRVRSIDATGVAHLLHWRKELRRRGLRLMLLAPGPAVRRTLAAMQLLEHFTLARDLADASAQCGAPGPTPPVQRDGTTRSLAWCGEIVASNVEDVWKSTIDHVAGFAANRATLVIVDLARLRFIDSSGAALMLRLKQWAHTLHAEVLFAHPQPNVRNVLRLTRLEQLLLEGDQ